MVTLRLTDLQELVGLERQAEFGGILLDGFNTQGDGGGVEGVGLDQGFAMVGTNAVQGAGEVGVVIDHIFEFGGVGLVPGMQAAALGLLWGDRDMVQVPVRLRAGPVGLDLE